MHVMADDVTIIPKTNEGRRSYVQHGAYRRLFLRWRLERYVVTLRSLCRPWGGDPLGEKFSQGRAGKTYRSTTRDTCVHYIGIGLT